MAFVRVQNTNAFNSGTTVTLTLGAATTAGNLLTLALLATNASDPFVSITDGSNTYVNAATVVVGGDRTNRSFYAKNISGGVTVVTITIAGGATAYGSLTEWSGADTVAPLDQSDGIARSAPGTATDGLTSSSMTTGFDNELIVGHAYQRGSAATVTHGTGYTGDDSSQPSFHSEYKTLATAGTAQATFTVSVDGTGDWGVIIMTFKAASGAAPTLMGAICL